MNENIGPITIKKMFTDTINASIEKGHGLISQNTDELNQEGSMKKMSLIIENND